MIQRIQSLLLLAVCLISIALFFVPVSEKAGTELPGITKTLTIISLSQIGPEGNTQISANYPLAILSGLIGIMSLFIIFRYQNRIQQIKLCMLTGLLAVVNLILAFYYSEAIEPLTMHAHYLGGTYLIAGQFVLLLAARRFIAKDEALVRAADRIR